LRAFGPAGVSVARAANLGLAGRDLCEPGPQDITATYDVCGGAQEPVAAFRAATDLEKLDQQGRCGLVDNFDTNHCHPVPVGLGYCHSVSVP